MDGNAAFMQMAIDLAVRNVEAGRGGPFGALVVRGGEVVATGVNRVTATNDPTAHAEVTAIREACRMLGTFQLTGCSVYTSCEPCPMCLAAIYWARCEGIYFAATAEDAASAGFDDAFLYEELKKPVGVGRFPLCNCLGWRRGRGLRRGRGSPVESSTDDYQRHNEDDGSGGDAGVRDGGQRGGAGAGGFEVSAGAADPYL